MSDTSGTRPASYEQWVRQNALAAAARVVAGQVEERTHSTVVIAKLEKLIPWAETYLRTGGFPPPPR